MNAPTNIALQIVIGVAGMFLLSLVDREPSDSEPQQAMTKHDVRVLPIDDFDRLPLHHGAFVRTPGARKLFSDTGVRIGYPKTTKIDDKWQYTGGEPSRQAIEQVIDGLERYPPEMIRASTIDWILLTPELTWDNQEVVTALNEDQRVFWINTTRAGREGGVESLTAYGVYRTHLDLETPLEGPNYHGNAYLNRTWGSSEHRCFVSAYAGFNGAADRGEIYRYMIADPDRLDAAARSNSCLGAKVEQVRAEIKQRKPELLPSE